MVHSASQLMVLPWDDSGHSMAFPHLHLAYNNFWFVLQTPGAMMSYDEL